jgi:chorismate mutase
VTDDPLIRALREQISEADRAVLAAFNARLELVARIKSRKAELGIGFVDPDQERRLLDDLARGNRGSLSDEGLRELFGEILDLTKREVGRRDEG